MQRSQLAMSLKTIHILSEEKESSLNSKFNNVLTSEYKQNLDLQDKNEIMVFFIKRQTPCLYKEIQINVI